VLLQASTGRELAEPRAQIAEPATAQIAVGYNASSAMAQR
jgi:hypothetical protein